MILHPLRAACLGLLLAVPSLPAQSPFQFPTANRSLFQPGCELGFFVPTSADRPWTTGTFGCVRTDGRQMHEGIDIRCLQRDKRGEPADPVLSTADGTVMYFNTKSGLSNYGKYIVIRHVVDGLELYSLYAHLSEIQPGLAVGKTVKPGERIATMGRTSNTASSISKDRAHVHFELNLMLNDRFAEWFKKTAPGERNDHGAWNGQNFLGLDPREVLLAGRDQHFNLANFIRSRTELCRVLVRSTNFSFLKRCPSLISKNPRAEKEGVAGYEIALDFNGLPFSLMPRAASEIKGAAKIQLLSVNEKEQQARACRKLVAKTSGKWHLSDRGMRELDLLIY